jgi:hypothetical protein
MIDTPSVISCPVYAHHWYLWHPPIGSWIALLAVLGVLVPLYREWNAISKRERAIWTLVMFSLVGLELWGLHRDRVDHDQEQADAECKQLQQFDKIADKIGTAITTSQTQFNTTMQTFSADESTRQAQFSATMRAFSSTESANQVRFGRLMDHEEQIADSLNGTLSPGNDPDPSAVAR